MADVFREIDEALREDRAKQLWAKYGTALIVAAVALVLAVGGYNLWQRYQVNQDQTATAELAAALSLVPTDPAAAAAQLAAIGEAAGGSHAVLARLYEAGIHVEQGEREEAVLLYRSVAENSSAPAVWRDLARILAVLNDLDHGDPAALTAELQPLTADDNPWRFSVRELTGLLAMRRGDTAQAQALFEQLAVDPAAPDGVRARAGMLAAALAGPPAE